MCMHARHTVNAVPDLRIAGGRLGDVFYHALQGLNCIESSFRCPRIRGQVPRRCHSYFYPYI